MPRRTLGEWLAWLEQLHPSSIDLGLERVRAAADNAGLLSPEIPIVTVGGTNGKGSVCALLESVLIQAGYRVGLYTSPHLTTYNERVRISLHHASDAELCAAFAHIEHHRGDISLTYFEFGTLAAMYIFAQRDVDIALLEVGLGGRLDAVNLWDADVAVITSLALDHTDWLGDTLAAIAQEKMGIARSQRPLVVAESEPPAELFSRAAEIGARLYLRERDYHGRSGISAAGHKSDGESRWSFDGSNNHYSQLPLPGLRGSHAIENAATAVQVIDLLAEKVNVTEEQIRTGLTAVRLRGRAQHVDMNGVDCIFDVAHNPQAIDGLIAYLQTLPAADTTTAVAAFMADKAIAEMLGKLSDQFACWWVGDLPLPRALSAQQLAVLLSQHCDARIEQQATIQAAFHSALETSRAGDRIVVFGSFVTVAETLPEHL